MLNTLDWLPLLFLGGLGCSLVFNGCGRGLGRLVGLVDQPDGRRKTHARVIPLVGGLAVFASTVLVLLAAFAWIQRTTTLSDADARELLGLLAGSAIICGVGVVDDCSRLRGRYKLMGQLVAVIVVILSGVCVQAVTLFGWELELGWLAIPFTMFWLLGAINSMNLLDGMDGLLGTVGTIVCLALAAIAAMHEHYVGAGVALAMAGALVGFLRYNLPPATVFLGDAGSMLVGLVVGVLAIRCSLKAPATVALAAPVALLILPILDTSAALVRRKLTGRSIFSTDRGHLHHCLLRWGLSHRKILLLICALSSMTVLGALGSIAWRSEELAVCSAMAVVTVLLSTRLFGNAEAVLVVKSLHGYAGGLLPAAEAGREIEVRLQGSAEWSELWKQLVDCAERHGCRSISLDVNSPAHHEGYHARWSRPASRFGEEPNSWSAVILLRAWGQTIGQVSVAGQPDAEPVWKKLAALTALTDGVETVLPTIHPTLPVPTVDTRVEAFSA